MPRARIEQSLPQECAFAISTSHSAAFWRRAFLYFDLAKEFVVRRTRNHLMVSNQESRICRFVEDLAQGRNQQSQGVPCEFHPCSSTNLVSSKGASLIRASRLPVTTPAHRRIDSNKIKATRIINAAVTAVSRRSLKINRKFS